MKWLVLVAFVAIAVGWVSFLRRYRRSTQITGALIGFLPFVLDPWHLIIAPFATPMWVGYVKGWQISLIDVLAIAVLVARGLHGKTPLKWPFLIYIGSVLFAVSFAPYFNLAMAYPVQLFRMFIVFLAVSRIASSEAGAKAVLAGMVAGLTLQCGLALKSILMGALQSGGTFGHQNLLGFATHPVLLMCFGLLLSGRWPRLAAWGFAIGCATVIVTASRGAIFVAGIGVALTLVVASLLHWTKRKAVFAFVTAGLMLVCVPLAQYSLDRRFAVQNSHIFGEDGERLAFERAAKTMIKDHPFGVGPNHYVYIANRDGYSSRAGVAWASGSRSTNVHNSYLLVNAETGYLGLFAFLGLFAGIALTLMRHARVYRSSGYSELYAGLACAFIAIAIHSKLEWVFVTFQAQYVMFIALGLGAGCVRQAQAMAPRAKRRPKAERVDARPAMAFDDGSGPLARPVAAS